MRFVACKRKSGLLTTLATFHCLLECSETNENVHNILKSRSTAEEKVDDIQVLTKEAAYANKAPVQASNKNENTNNLTHWARTATAAWLAAGTGSGFGGRSSHIIKRMRK